MNANELRPVTTEDFVHALSSLPPAEIEKRRVWLTLHLRAEARASTATVLANAAGYRGWRGINSSYGRLAKRIRLILGRPKEPAGADELYLLCEFVKRGSLTNQDCLLVMRPEFAAALEASGLLNG